MTELRDPTWTRPMRGAIRSLRPTHALSEGLPAMYLSEPESANGDGAAPGPQLPAGTFVREVTERGGDSWYEQPGVWCLVLEPARSDEPLRSAAAYLDGVCVWRGPVREDGDSVTLDPGGAAAATYRWAFARETLRLEPVQDPNAARAALLRADVWTRRTLAARFVAAFDEALAPIHAELDSLEAYVDPLLAPVDGLDWLGSWFGLRPDRSWSVGRRRHRIARAVELFRWWGTVQGVREYVAVFTGLEPDRIEVIDSGGVAASVTPGGPLPGHPEPRLLVRLKVPDPENLDLARIRKAVAAAKPAHVVHEVEVVAK